MVLILPLPAIVLDLFLAISITLSILILMTALFIQTPLEFSAFPTVLLISTMLRLSLNLASTRLILSHGHEGTAAAGHVIEAFGNFVMGGNFVIGIIVFAILVIVNFVVITKGSGRIAEVAARFHLDAMPGKQMAIDADLSAGLIDEATAKERRKELEDESGFFGAMDGASKFVRGDAIAGLLDRLHQRHRRHHHRRRPAGHELCRRRPHLHHPDRRRRPGHPGAGADRLHRGGPAGLEGRRHRRRRQGDDEAALRLSAGARHVGRRDAGAGAAAGHSDAALPRARRRRCRLLAWKARKTQRAPPRRPKRPRPPRPNWPPQPPPPPRKSRSRTALKIDDLKIELGYALLPLVNGPDGTDRLTEQIKALRRSLAIEMGFVMPAVRILDNVQLEANTYIIKIKEVDAGTGKIWPNQFMVMDPAGNQVGVPGIHTIEPTFGLPATWVDAALKEEASLKGYTVVDAATVLSTHLTELLKNNMSGPAVLWRGAEAPEGPAEGTGRAGQGHRAEPGHGLRHPARAAAAAGRADLDPRSLHHSRRHRRRAGLLAQPRDHGRARPRPAGAADLRAKHLLQRLSAADRAVGQMGAGVCRVDRRHRRGTQPGDAALKTVGVHDRGAQRASSRPPAKAKRRCW